jgi:hypothetical protein
MTFGPTHPEWCQVLATLISELSKIHKAREALWRTKGRTFALPVRGNLCKARLLSLFSRSIRLRPSTGRIRRRDNYYPFVGDWKGCLQFNFTQIQIFQSSGICFNNWKFTNTIRHHSSLGSGLIIAKQFLYRWKCYDSSLPSAVHWYIFILWVHYKFPCSLCCNCQK